MPTILVKDGFRLYFFANEGKEPIHVHVQYQAMTAKFWIKPIQLAKNCGMNANELSKARIIVRENENLIEEKWNEYFG